jgi:hypothetical protein
MLDNLNKRTVENKKAFAHDPQLMYLVLVVYGRQHPPTVDKVLVHSGSWFRLIDLVRPLKVGSTHTHTHTHTRRAGHFLRSKILFLCIPNHVISQPGDFASIGRLNEIPVDRPNIFQPHPSTQRPTPNTQRGNHQQCKMPVDSPVVAFSTIAGAARVDGDDSEAAVLKLTNLADDLRGQFQKVFTQANLCGFKYVLAVVLVFFECFFRVFFPVFFECFFPCRSKSIRVQQARRMLSTVYVINLFRFGREARQVGLI